MENDIASAPAGYMFMYITIFALFAWNFYRIIRLRSERSRVRISDDRHARRSDRSGRQGY